MSDVAKSLAAARPSAESRDRPRRQDLSVLEVQILNDALDKSRLEGSKARRGIEEIECAQQMNLRWIFTFFVAFVFSWLFQAFT